MIERPASKAPFAGHPAYDEHTRNYVATPRPGPRVKPEAQENADRNKGSLDLSWDTNRFARQLHSGEYSSGRYGSLEGRENLLRSRGTLANIIHAQASGKTPRAAVPCRAITTQAAEIAEQSKGGRMNLLIGNYGKNEVTPRPQPRVKMEAAENYQMSRGSAMNNLLHDAKAMPASARPGPRVKPEAEQNAMKNRGSMNAIMRVYTPRY